MLTSWLPRELIKLSTQCLAALCVIFFILCMADAETRRAIDAFNQQSRANAKSQTWLQRTFRRIGDPRLEVCSGALCVEFSLLLFSSRTDILVFVWTGFGMIILLRILTLKSYVTTSEAQA